MIQQSKVQLEIPTFVSADSPGRRAVRIANFPVAFSVQAEPLSC